MNETTNQEYIIELIHKKYFVMSRGLPGGGGGGGGDGNT